MRLDRRRQTGNVIIAFDGREPGLLIGESRIHGIQIYALQHRLQHRHALLICMTTRIDHVFERNHAVGPALQRAIHRSKIPIVFQPFLKLVRRKQVVEVARLRRIGQILQLPVPTGFIRRFVIRRLGFTVMFEDGIDQLALANRGNRLVNADRLFTECIDRRGVLIRGLLIRG